MRFNLFRRQPAPAQPTVGFAELNALALRKSQMLNEVGLAGDRFFLGRPEDPYNSELAGPGWFHTVDEMRRNMVHVGLVETAISLPIIGTTWHFTGGNDALREMLEHNLLDDSHDWSMTDTWPDVLRRACLSAIYGLWGFEKVLAERDGQVLWDRFADRLPHSILRFELDESGQLDGITQQGIRPQTGEAEMPFVPAEKLVLLPYRREGNNWWGLSILRGAWRHYTTVDRHYRMIDIGHERSLLGTLVGHLPAHYSDADKAAFMSLLMAYRHGSNSTMVLPQGYEIDDGSKYGQPQDIGHLAYVEMHEKWILRAALADFVALGESARALGDVKIRFFLLAWEALATAIESAFNRYAVRQLAELNMPGVRGDDVPRLCHTPIGQSMNLEAAADFLKVLLDGKAVTPDADLEDWFRDGLGMPERQETPDAVMTPGGTGGPPVDPTIGETPMPPSDRSVQLAEAPAAVTRAVDRVKRDMGRALDDWQAAGQEHLAAITRSLLEQAAKVQAGDAQATDLAVPQSLVDGWASWMEQWLQRAAETAWSAIGKEAGTSTTPPQELLDRLPQQAKVVATDLAQTATRDAQLGLLRGDSLDVLAHRLASSAATGLESKLVRDGQATIGAAAASADAGKVV